MHAAGIKSFAQINRIQKVAFQFWLAGLLCNIAAGTYTLTTLHMNASKSSTTEKTAEEKKRDAKSTPLLFVADSRETYAIKYQLTQDVFDALIPAGSLGYLSFMDEGLIGLAGVVSSLMGGYTQWIKTK